MATDGSFEKSQPLKLTIPKLKNARQFIQWKEHVQSYLSTIQARCYLDYKVQDPLYVSEESENIAGDIQERAWLLVRHFFTSNDFKKYITNLNVELLQKIITTPKTKIYTIESADIPYSLLQFALKSEVIIQTGESLYMIYETREDFIKARVQYIRDHEKARTVLRSTLSFEYHHLLKTLDVYSGFQNLCSYFEKDEVVERAALKN